jgi:hypothetical protein
VRRVDDYRAYHDFASLAIKLVENKAHLAFPLVYRIIELEFILPMATASIERAFSAMNIIKTDLRNRMKDEWLKDLTFFYIEKELFKELDPKKIKRTFQSMKDPKMSLPPKWLRCSKSFRIGMFSYLLPHLSLTH